MRRASIFALLAACGGGGGAAPDAGPAALSWRALAPLPAARQETAVVALGGKVYVIGGFDADGGVVATVEAFDGSGWTAVAPLPQPLHHANAAVAGERIWVCGALQGLGFVARGVTMVYDPGADRWSDRAAMPGGRERGASGVAVVGDLVYVAGGLRAGQAVADFDVYDTAKDRWTSLPDVPEARDHLVAAAAGGLVYAAGGRHASLATNTGRVDAFDPTGGSWTPRAPLPTPRGGASAALYAGRIVVAGGEGNPAAASGVFADVEAYDPAADRWTILAPMATPRHGTGAAVLGDLFIVPGGASKAGFGAVAVVEGLGGP